MIALQAKRAGPIMRQHGCALMLVRSYQLCCRFYVFGDAAQHGTGNSLQHDLQGVWQRPGAA